jgi:hypothetical protein
VDPVHLDVPHEVDDYQRHDHDDGDYFKQSHIEPFVSPCADSSRERRSGR